MIDVLLVSPTSAPGGAERALSALARRLPEHGYRPRAILLEPGPFEDWLSDIQCPYEVLPMGRTRNLPRTIPLMGRLWDRSRGVSVVVANQSKGHAIAGSAAVAARTPCIWWQHGIPSRSLIELTAAAIPSAAVVCTSEASLLAQLHLTPNRKVELIHPGIDVEGIRRHIGSGMTLRRRHGWGTAPVVGIVARLQPWKGQELFLRAAAIVAERCPEARFAVVGGAILGWEGDYPNRLTQLAALLGIGDKVLFTGHQDNVYSWFDAFDVTVTASSGEPFGLVTVEALALGKALVGVRSGGTTEIVQEGVTGLLVPPDDPTAMAEAILRVLSDPMLASAIRRGAASRAETFSDMAMTSKFALLMGEVVRRI
jgi:glycosyltransferase involved in cell wall biosynthesis